MTHVEIETPSGTAQADIGRPVRRARPTTEKRRPLRRIVSLDRVDVRHLRTRVEASRQYPEA